VSPPLFFFLLFLFIFSKPQCQLYSDLRFTVKALDQNVHHLFGQFEELKTLVTEVASLSGILETAESAAKAASSQATAIGTLEDVQVRKTS